MKRLSVLLFVIAISFISGFGLSAQNHGDYGLDVSGAFFHPTDAMAGSGVFSGFKVSTCPDNGGCGLAYSYMGTSNAKPMENHMYYFDFEWFPKSTYDIYMVPSIGIGGFHGMLDGVMNNRTRFLWHLSVSVRYDIDDDFYCGLEAADFVIGKHDSMMLGFRIGCLLF
ncbi:MAG: hypothetical protein LKI42_03570 [Bacteroidales bacterium]|jgi:hypothetical protein|nr:hypothetical protein [Bacteroidales bacterium]MCI1785121.1 hypothetical protein [Bacteroidales bacterium]